METATMAHVADKKLKKQSWFLRASKRIGLFVPSMMWVVLVYFLLSLNGVSQETAIFSFPNGTSLLVNDIIYLFMTITVLIDVMKVSLPGMDNSIEAQLMNYSSMLMGVFFVLAFTTEEFKMFATAQFAVMVMVNFLAAFVAIKVNARTLKRTIDGRGAGGDEE